MTQAVELLSPRAGEFAEELRSCLNQHFQIAARVREIGQGRGYRLFQVPKSGNRHLVDVRLVDPLPAAQRIAGVLVMAPTELVASKVVAYQQRRGSPKSGTDWRDIALLLLTFPELKNDPGPVTDRLQAMGSDSTVLAAWREIVAQEIRVGEEDEEF